MVMAYFRISMRIVLVLSMFFGCSEQAASMNTRDASTRQTELQAHIQLPLQPQQVQWQVIAHHKDETRLPGGRFNWKIVHYGGVGASA